ncbi:MAG: orotidine-5'-phosphate decarboxylase [Acidimicrobiia bacterium]|nr:orotidine-5'-phosphate decarboxylase [Acidimicrobiia bacterium]
MKNPIIVALDVATTGEAARLVEKLQGHVGPFKVGMELYAAGGPQFVRELTASGADVFLDMKFYDIPETVRRATAQVAELGVKLLTVHGSGAVMRAAVEGKAGAELRLLAVTVLTSFDQQDLADLGYPCLIGDLVSLRVSKAREAGIDGIVCSPLEVGSVRRIAGPEAVLVTPGVRSANAAQGDQKRVATPAEAIADGADYLVIGRQITRASDPAEEAARILEEIKAG